MKKHLKKIVLFGGFVAMAAAANAGAFRINCPNGESYNYISFEEEGSAEEIDDVEMAWIDLCL